MEANPISQEPSPSQDQPKQHLSYYQQQRMMLMVEKFKANEERKKFEQAAHGVPRALRRMTISQSPEQKKVMTRKQKRAKARMDRMAKKSGIKL